MLDWGIGYGWWETFLKEQKIRIPRIVGVDVNEEAVQPRLKNVEYILSSHFQLKEKFDLVVCWDSFHCFPQKNLFDTVNQNGLLLVSEPRPFVHLLEKIKKQGTILVDEWVGEREKSRVLLMRKNFA
jgi:2-polyprenyl-3-methyl-5-hydroxy-6-metoxy-1,4-benzoquinol methylase